MHASANSFKGYLDGKLIQEVSDTKLKVRSITASASHDEKTGDVILKVVNAANSAAKAEIKLKTTTAVAGRATIIVLTGASGAAMNSFDQPRNVAPVESIVQDASNAFRHTFPANSMTVKRLKGR